MSTIVAKERALYEDVWGGIQHYGDHSPGAQHVGLFQAMTGASSGSVLDAGCGSGKGALALRAAGFDLMLCDLTGEGRSEDVLSLPFVATCLWRDLRSVAYLAGVQTFDYVYCCDVLEHIPTEYTMLTLQRLLEVTGRGLFLTIALVPDQFGVWVGRPLHHTVRPFTWWRDRLRDLGHLVECRDLLLAGAYLVTPR